MATLPVIKVCIETEMVDASRERAAAVAYLRRIAVLVESNVALSVNQVAGMIRTHAAAIEQGRHLKSHQED